MDTEDLVQPNTNWEVYRDALAPVQNKPLPKPWERAPVPAHAPRLQGRQIWKKVAIRKESNRDSDASQAELDCEGRGARKRLRVAGGKENITDALWLTHPGKPFYDDPNTSEEVDSGFGGKEKDTLSFVPRKRTNTDHVITPRKPLRQATLNGQAQTLALTQIVEGEVEKPARRRKSLRKSTRKSMGPVTSESVSLIAIMTKEFPQEIESDVQYTVDNYERKDEERLLLARTSPKNLGISEASQTATTALEEFEDERLPPHEDEKQPIDDHKVEKSIVRVPLNDLEDQFERSSPTAHMKPLTTLSGQVETDQKPEVCVRPLDAGTLVLPSIEDELDPDSGRHLKSTGTPKKRKGQGIRRGTRRSTRTRASSAKDEEQPIQMTVTNAGAETPLNTSCCVEAPHDASPVPRLPDEAEEALAPAAEAANTPPSTVTVVESSVIPTESEPLHPLQNIDLSNDTLSFELEPILKSGRDEASSEMLQSSTDEQGTTEGELLAIECPDPYDPANQICLENLVEDSLIDVPSPRVDDDADFPLEEIASNDSSPVRASLASERIVSPSLSDEQTVEILESIEPVFVPADQTLSFKTRNILAVDPLEISAENSSTFVLAETIPETAPSNTYDHDETDMLRNFLTRVKADKAAKAQTSLPKRKRSLPHSPLQLPLGEDDSANSPAAEAERDEFDIGLPVSSPSKRRKRNEKVADDEDASHPTSIRRSGRTRLPVVKAPVAAPSFIPVRRLGQDGDATVTIKRTEEKELAALTRVNTRKNKGGALSAAAVLVKKAEEKDDPALRQRLLKEVFDEKTQKKKKEKKTKSVAWAVELAQFQEAGKKTDVEKDEKEKDKEKVEEKKGALRVGIKSKIALGAVNGTPAPKRKTRERS